MSRKLIGFGQCSPFFLFILGNAIFKCLRECLFNFTAFDPKSEIGLFGFIPILSGHSIITNIYIYFSYITLGLIVYFIVNKKIMIEKFKIKKKGKKGNELIHKKDIIITTKRMFQILIVCLIFVLHSDLIKMLYLFGISGFDIWTSDILFILLFMNLYFSINIYKHQKYSLLFIIISCTILLFISTFFPYYEKKNSVNFNSYEIVNDLTGSYFYSILIFLLFLLISLVTSFGRVLSKMLMDIKFISPYMLIIITGIIGFSLNITILLLSTKYKCIYSEKTHKFIEKFCLVHYNNYTYYDNIAYDYNITYYDNFIIYITNLKDRYHRTKKEPIKNDYFLPRTKFFIEIFAMTPIFFVVSFLEFTCEIFTIYYLNPNYILIRDNIYYGISRVIKILSNIDNYSEYITLSKFFILELAEIFAIFGYSIYLEIIELRFYGFDKNLKRHIIERGETEVLLYSLQTISDNSYSSDYDNE